jgi:hypothetical protein
MLPAHESCLGKAPKDALESAAANLGGSIPPDGESAPGRLYEARELQIQILAGWAEKSSLKVPVHALPEMRQHGNEHLICFEENSSRWIKATTPDRFGFIADTDFRLNKATQQWEGGAILREALPSEYLRRLLLHNDVFKDDVKMEAIAVGGHGLQVVTSQPAIVGDAPDYDELRNFMRQLSFSEIPGLHLGYRESLSFFRESDRVLVFDAHPANAIRTGKMIAPIDFIIQKADDCLLDVIQSRLHP